MADDAARVGENSVVVMTAEGSAFFLGHDGPS
jgi:hypothetical protein